MAEMNPSTYQQVRENMNEIEKLKNAVGDISSLTMGLEEMQNMLEELQKSILEPSDEGDIKRDENGNIIVEGVHTDSDNPTENTPPSKYTHGLSVSIKKVSTIGLTGKHGITGDYVFVLTVTKDGKTGPAVDPYQLAFMNSANGFYRRNSTGGDAWGDWLEPAKARPQIVDGRSKPNDQLEGEYWCEPIPD